MLVFLLELPVLLLTVGKGKAGILAGLVLYLAVCAASFLICRKKHLRIPAAIRFPIASVLLAAAGGAAFYLRWSTSGRLLSAAGLIGRPAKQSCIIIAAFLSLLSLFGIDYLLKLGMALAGRDPDRESASFSDRFTKLYIFLTAFLTVSLNSKCSPLYPFNDWVDANTMFTVGKGVLRGFVPYRDLYEQKGPMIIFLHTLGAAVSFDSFLGMWILEVIFCFAFLYLSFKTAELYFGKNACLWIPPAALAVYSCFSFRNGDSGEEFCLPCLAFALLAGCRALKERTLPTRKEFLWIGLTSGFVFWVKYSLTGFYAGWFLVFLAFAVFRKKVRELAAGIGLIAAGVAVVSAPIFLYFAVHGALKPFLEVYFYNNLFYYAQNELSAARKLYLGWANIRRFTPLAPVCLVLGLLRMLMRKEWRTAVFLCVTAGGLFVFVYISGWYHAYYSFIFNVFAVFGFFWLMDLRTLLPSRHTALERTASALTLMLCMLGLGIFSRNMPYLQWEKEDLMQNKMKAVIEASGIEDPTVLSYEIGDAGVNTAAGLIPGIRFFCFYNNRRNETIQKEQQACIDTGCADYIIAFSKFEDDHPEFDAYIYQGWFEGTYDDSSAYYHYFLRK